MVSQAIVASIAVLGGIVSASASVPYIIETVRGHAKPRIVTWATWCLLAGIAAVASFSAGQIASGVFGAIGVLATGSVALAGLRYGSRKYESLDIFCQIAVFVGIVFWLLLDSPLVAILAVVIIDFIGLVPTLRHAWQLPFEESAISFLIIGGGGILTSLAVVIGGNVTAGAITYPLYVAVSMTSCGLLILARQQTKPRPAVKPESLS